MILIILQHILWKNYKALSSMNNKVFFLSIGMQGQNEAFEEPGINSIVSYLRESGIETSIELVKNGKIDVDKIAHQSPILIGMSVYVDTYHLVKKICKELKEKLKDVFIVLGGYAATYYPEVILREIPEADFISIGEGEVSIMELAYSLKNGSDIKKVHNLVYRENNTLKYTEMLPLIEDMDKLPFAARDIAKQYNVAEIWVSTSRGCSHNCSFCCSHDFWRKNKSCAWRGRSVKNILEEIEYLTKDLGIRQFEFIDNSFEDPYPFMDRAMKIAKGIIDKNLKVAYGTNMRAETFTKISEAQLKLLKQSGFSYVYLGIEGFNKDSLKFYNKAATVENNEHALSLLKKNGIVVDIGFINFNPYSNIEGLRENVINLCKHDLAFLQYVLTFLFVFRGTAIYERLKKEGIMYRDYDIDDYMSYHYTDSKVGQLATFLINYKKKLEENGITKENYFLVYFKKKLYQLSNLLEQYGFKDEKISGYIEEAKILIESETKRINEINSNWFLQLLDMAHGTFDEEEATRISDMVFYDDDYQKELDKLSKYKDTIYFTSYKKFMKSNLKIKF